MIYSVYPLLTLNHSVFQYKEVFFYYTRESFAPCVRITLPAGSCMSTQSYSVQEKLSRYKLCPVKLT